MAYQILVVDDEPSLRAMVTDLLKCSPKVGQKLCGKAILNSVLDRT